MFRFMGKERNKINFGKAMEGRRRRRKAIEELTTEETMLITKK